MHQYRAGAASGELSLGWSQVVKQRWFKVRTITRVKHLKLLARGLPITKSSLAGRVAGTFCRPLSHRTRSNTPPHFAGGRWLDIAASL